jgi:hypothetical protein
LTINQGLSSFVWPTIAPFTYTAGVRQGPVISSNVGSSGAVTHSYEGVTPTIYASQTNKPTNAGNYKVTASVPADANYAGHTATFDFTIEKAPHTISISSVTKRYGAAPFPIAVDTGGSTGSLTYTSSNTNVATVSSAGEVTIVGVGATTIGVEQAADDNYNAATADPQPLTVVKGFQSIIFGTLPNKVFGESQFDLTATASSGLDVSYASSNTDVATVFGNTVTIVGAGTTVITASQDGNPNYNAAPAVEQTLTVDSATPTTPTGSTFTNAFGSLNPTNVGADGLAYLMKYALGGTNTNDKVSLPTVALNGSALTLTAVVRTNDTNVQIVGQWITGLGGTWSNVPTQNVTPSSNSNNVPVGCQRRDFSMPKDANSRLFLRLKATQTP